MKMNTFRGVAVSAALGFAMVIGPLSRAVADDLNPPSWRGQPGTTFEEWDFSTAASPVAPDSYINPYGTPMATPTAGTGQSWMSEQDGRQGVWLLSGNILATIPNSPEPNPVKDIWVQLTWEPQAGGNRPTVWDPDYPVYSTQIGADLALGGPWLLSTYEIQLFPNPSSETVRIDGGINVDQLVIDTICVPEPATLGLCLLGGLAVVFARRR